MKIKCVKVPHKSPGPMREGVIRHPDTSEIVQIIPAIAEGHAHADSATGLYERSPDCNWDAACVALSDARWDDERDKSADHWLTQWGYVGVGSKAAE